MHRFCAALTNNDHKINPNSNPITIINPEGIFVKVSKANVPKVKAYVARVLSKGWNKKIAAAATRPALAAVIPSREARTALNFFRLSQNLITKKIKNVPGRKIPAADIKAPAIWPPIPACFIDSAPM